MTSTHLPVTPMILCEVGRRDFSSISSFCKMSGSEIHVCAHVSVNTLTVIERVSWHILDNLVNT